MTHYYEKWDKEATEWKQNTQEITGYFNGTTQTRPLSDGDLLIGVKMTDFALTFVPDKNSNQIRGIANYNNSDYMYYDDLVGGEFTFRSWNPLEW